MADPATLPAQVSERAGVSAEPPTWVRYRVMALLCALAFLTYLDRVCIMRAQVDIQHDLVINDEQIGWVMGAFWLAYGLFEIPSGWITDRFGPRLALLRIVLAWSLFTALSGTAIGFLSLLLCRFLFGVGEAGAFPSMAAVQSRWVPARQRASFGGILWLSARWGGAFSFILFGMLIRAVDSMKLHTLPEPLAHAASWRFGFWTAGVLGVLWCCVFYPLFRNYPSQTPGVNDAERALLPDEHGDSSTGHETPPGLWRALLSCQSLWAMGLLYFCGSFAWSFFVSWAPKYLKNRHHISFENSEWMMTWPLFCGGISCLVGGSLCDWMVKRTGSKLLCRAVFPVTGCVLAAAAMFGIQFVSSPQQAAVLMCVAAAAYDFGQSANWATIVDIGGRYPGIATGYINMIGNFANFLQPVLGAMVFSRFGWNVLFAGYSFMFLAAATMWIFIHPERVFHERVG